MPHDQVGNAAAGGVVQPCPLAKTPHWLEVELLDEDGSPVPNQEFKLTLPNGQAVRGYLDQNGYERLDPIDDPGNCQVTFPGLDPDSWQFDSTAGPKSEDSGGA